MRYEVLIDGKWLTDAAMMPVAAMMDSRSCYGDGFFSTIGVHEGRLLFADGHRARLMAGADAFSLTIDTDAIMAKLRIAAEDIGEGILKLIVLRSAQRVRGYGYTDGQAQVFMKLMPSVIYADIAFISGIPVQKPIHAVALNSTLPHRIARLSGMKLIACPEQVFAHAELLEIQAHWQENLSLKPSDGIIRNVHGDWISATMGNICYRLDGQWYTPSVQLSGVAGVLRARLLALGAMRERRLTQADLVALDALCTMNAVRGIIPILSLDGRMLSTALPIHQQMH